MHQTKSILVSGASGLIGSALCLALTQRGHTVRTLSRSHGDRRWDVGGQTLEKSALDEIDCVIHLAGENIAQRWTPAARERILQSRTESTRLLAANILKQERPIDFISASGINFYGETERDKPATEMNPAGSGFLAAVCQAWEHAAQPLQEAALRTVFIRTGVVLSARGGALAKMLPPFRLGLGGRIGSGEQKMSWISLPDIVRIYITAVEDQSLSGAINATAPQAVSNLEFTKTLGRVLKRSAVCPIPAVMINLLFGAMGRETILANLNVAPARLVQKGFEWHYPELEPLLRVEVR
ncbi:MAG: TIGR01777 family oxidoreductase [Kiritimatiellae bacterium]|nr:TIGR01777 family oxidoreductase [Kiritimatiellia bacterium]